MKAIVYHEYGSPDVLHCEEIEKPAPGDNEVLIEVRAASLNPLDCGELKGVPYIFRVLLGLRGPTATQPGRPGVDLAGVIRAVGKNVTEFKTGDDVFGLCLSDPEAKGLKVWLHSQGSFAEYACARGSALAPKPETVTFEEAGAVPVAALTALQGLRDKGKIQVGQKVLVHGAGGGVGTFAVQIAKALGAEVTGVTSTKNLDSIRNLGADRLIDYTREDFTRGHRRYDLIFDCHAVHPLSACRRVLSPSGVYVAVGTPVKDGGSGFLARLVEMQLLSRLGSQKFVTFLAKPNRKDLRFLADLMASGKLRPVIDKCYSLPELPEAIRYFDAGHGAGKVVVKIGCS